MREDPLPDTRTAIVEAAAMLLRRDGTAAMTTRAVARAAGVQGPTLYRLFGDKDGLIDAVAEHVMATYVAGETRAVDTPTDDPVAELRTAWATHVEFGLANPDLYALIATPGRRGPSPATVAGFEVLRTRIRRLAAAGSLRVDEERALMMVHAAGIGAVFALLSVPAAERDAGLADELLTAVLDRITTTPSAAPVPTLTSVAVTLAARIAELPGLSAGERALLAEWLDRSVRGLRDG